MTLTEFLLARIAEDEEAARAAWSDSGWRVEGDKITSPRDVIAKWVEGRTAAHIVRQRPTRVLAECEAKRRIVGEYVDLLNWDPDGRGDDGIHGERIGLEFAAKALALPYADHPDYRDEWRP